MNLVTQKYEMSANKESRGDRLISMGDRGKRPSKGCPDEKKEGDSPGETMGQGLPGNTHIKSTPPVGGGGKELGRAETSGGKSAPGKT